MDKRLHGGAHKPVNTRVTFERPPDRAGKCSRGQCCTLSQNRSFRRFPVYRCGIYLRESLNSVVRLSRSVTVKNQNAYTMKVNITKAHELTGKSRTTIYKHISTGKISASGSKEDGYEIDISELERVYGLKNRAPPDTSSNVHPEQNNTKTDEHDLFTQITLLRQQLQILNQERHRERDQMQEQIAHLQDTLSNAQEQQTRLTALLKDQREDKIRKEGEDQALLIKELRAGQARLQHEIRLIRDRNFLSRWLALVGGKKPQARRRARPPAT